MNRIWEHFKIRDDKEEQETVIEVIKSGVVFKGTNLWVLIFAIFIASLGLNVNSTAVIIGAMLISPLMGPIMGMGLGTGINDVWLLRKSIFNYGLATSVALATSTFYFLLSPLNDAHSEILARTSPNIYDVLIALFGGFAGILAANSKLKGNVIPGVAIATALMPPLCTAGYGLATLRLEYFLGAFYLFVINTVFIALSTVITVRLLQYPYAHLPDPKAHSRTQRILVIVVICTLMPSLYFGYDIVKQNRFLKKAEHFVEVEAVFPNNYLLHKSIDPKTRTIQLTFGGEEIHPAEIDSFKNRLSKHDMEGTKLLIKQGFSYLSENHTDEKSSLVNQVLVEKEKELQRTKAKLDSVLSIHDKHKKIFDELRILRPDIQFLAISPAIRSDTSKNDCALLDMKSPPSANDKKKLEEWLKARLENDQLTIIFNNNPNLSKPKK